MLGLSWLQAAGSRWIVAAMDLFVAPTMGFRLALCPRHHSTGAPKP